MADFCKQCLLEMFGEDLQDFSFNAPDGMCTAVLCEGCGPIHVANDGTCLTVGCLRNHNKERETMAHPEDKAEDARLLRDARDNMAHHRPQVRFDYKNHHGKPATRNVVVDSVEYIVEPGFGYSPGWFISGFDLDKEARRSFAFGSIILPGDSNMKFWKLLQL